MSDDKPSRILLGRIGAAHGIRGEVLVTSFAEAPEDVAAYGPLSDEAGVRTFELKVVRVTPKGVVARIKGVADRTAAETLRGTDLYVAREKLPAPGDDEFYHADLVGLDAVTPDGTLLGHVLAVQNFGAGDLIEIRLAESTRTEFVPFSDACVPEVDVAAGRIVVMLPQAAPDEGPETEHDLPEHDLPEGEEPAT